MDKVAKPPDASEKQAEAVRPDAAPKQRQAASFSIFIGETSAKFWLDSPSGQAVSPVSANVRDWSTYACRDWGLKGIIGLNFVG
jgi:hypothetical protein